MSERFTRLTDVAIQLPEGSRPRPSWKDGWPIATRACTSRVA